MNFLSGNQKYCSRKRLLVLLRTGLRFVKYIEYLQTVLNFVVRHLEHNMFYQVPPQVSISYSAVFLINTALNINPDTVSNKDLVRNESI